MKPALFPIIALLGFVLPPAAFGAADGGPAKTKAAPGQFSVNDLPADQNGAALLTIPAAGRYAIRSKSASGARIEIVDMIAGPGEFSGAAGLRDGRIDALLDRGVYKVRVSGAKGASGKVKLTADPFAEADGKRPALAEGQIVSSELGDLQQRSFALEVGASGRVSVEAVGRALQDLRLWRADGELVDIAAEKSSAEPRPGRSMTRARLEGAVSPGKYFVTAYGGEPLVWPEGAGPRPLLVRVAPAQPLTAGVAEGVFGPFGSARFEAPPAYDAFRLELAQQSNARLSVRRGASQDLASIGKTSREPEATVFLSSDGKESARLEATGYEGQSYTLRALKRGSRLSFEGVGRHLVAVDAAGEGGDEVPATALFARIEKDGKTRVLASDMPRIAPGRAWHGRFNLRGTTSLLFEAGGDGPVAVDVKGVKTRATIEPALGALAPRADGRDPSRYDLMAGFYLLTLEPSGGAVGVADVTLGTPGVAAPQSPPPAPRTMIFFGERQLESDGSYLLLANVAPKLLTGPRVTPLPADLEKAPLPLWQSADSEISLPVRTPKSGKIVVRDAKGGEFAPTLADEKTENDARLATVKIAAAGKARALGLAWAAEEAKSEEAAKGAETGKPSRAPPAASVDRPAFFDLNRDETKSVRFTLTQGGLYRIETLGRLQTALAVGTSFSPRIGEGENNGAGHNALVTAYLRAGAWRAAVTAKESSGHLGLAVTPAALVSTAKLIDAGAARAALDAGKGAVVPFEITREGTYRLDLLGVSREWRARLEDADGWPLTPPGKLTHLTRAFEKGAYRLVVLPEDVEARMVARLTPIVAKPALEGHGPHALSFGAAQNLQWREPQGKDALRAPDVWRFSLAGEANVDLSIGEGMIGEIIKGASDSAGRVSSDHSFKGKLAAGDYRVEAKSLAHDDRLDYAITLNSRELQSGAARRADLPATFQFTIAADRIVDLTSFGGKELFALLKDASGAVIERLHGRAEDWNIALSRRLPAGAYTLDVREAGSSETSDTEASDASETSEEETPAAESDESEDTRLEFRLALPAESDDGPLAFKGVKNLAGENAHALTLAPAPSGSLTLIAAQSEREIALSIERRDVGGAWRSIGVERGLAPVAAWPAETDKKGEWRAVVWPVGGGGAQISIAARAIETRAQSLGEISFDMVDGLPAPVCAGLAEVPSASLVRVIAPESGLFAGSAPGRLLSAARAGTLAPQSEALWIVARGDCEQRARLAAFEWKGSETAIDIGAGDSAVLPASAPPSGKARLLLARSAFGQPGLEAGRGMAAAPGAALALTGEGPARLWNAGGAEPLRATLRAVDVETLAPAQGGALYSGVIPPMSAQPVAMDKAEPLAFDLAPGLAAFSAPDEARKFAIFADDGAVSRVVNNAAADIWLVNLTDAPAPARVAVQPGKPEALTTARAYKRFFGAGGEISMRVAAEPGDRLVTAGGAAAFVSDKGAVKRGASIALDGPGEVVLAYKPGLVAAWLERAGKGPWKAPAPRALAAPQRVAMEGEAMSFALKQSAPVLLDVRASAPAIVAFTQNGRRELDAFASGVEFHRYMAAGDATLEIYAPHEGALAGTLDVSAQPVVAVHEGVNDAVALAPGASALFTFEVPRESEIGVGLRADPDKVNGRLMDAAGKTLGEGVAQSMKLAPGRYFVEARAPADAAASVVRLAVIGLSPPPAGPPDEETAKFLELAGLKKNKTR